MENPRIIISLYFEDMIELEFTLGFRQFIESIDKPLFKKLYLCHILSLQYLYQMHR